eukprot:CAMPEP_0196245474 /NCGR_PEP_ID=MMETSP0913-20130531/33294_1 /TAXON_ID=49265 /ORGANISM="Thalassiosira rotula, Strain GSO102" /LENGTH=30 /DNA_ID= /DNA_START= /DNA_END= /DNA_ORIENTATION=
MTTPQFISLPHRRLKNNQQSHNDAQAATPQ